MDKPADDLAAAFGAVAARRDAQLRSDPIAAARLERLLEVVAFEFPLESALRELARQRDDSLARQAGHIPAGVEAALAKQVEQLRPITNPTPPAPRYCGSFLYRRWREALAPRAIVTAAVVLLAGLLYFGTGPARTREIGNSRRETPAFSPDSPNGAGSTGRRFAVEFGERFLAGSSDHLALQVNAADLARLHPALLSLTSARLPDRYATKWNLRLELPVAEILGEPEERGTP